MNNVERSDSRLTTSLVVKNNNDFPQVQKDFTVDSSSRFDEFSHRVQRFWQPESHRFLSWMIRIWGSQLHISVISRMEAVCTDSKNEKSGEFPLYV